MERVGFAHYDTQVFGPVALLLSYLSKLGGFRGLLPTETMILDIQRHMTLGNNFQSGFSWIQIKSLSISVAETTL